MNSDYKYLFKMILVGDSGVGKTSFLKRYTDETFETDYITTIGVDFKIKTALVDGDVVKLQLWDTAGQERFSSITKNYYRGAHGIIVMFDLTNKSSFESIKDWLRKIQENASPDCEVMLLGSKVDLQSNIEVDEQAIDRFLEERKIQKSKFYKVSAKENIHVATVFENLARTLVERTKKSGSFVSKDKSAFDFTTARDTKRCC